MQETMNTIHRRIVEDYLQLIDANDPPEPDQIESDLLSMLNNEIEQQNASRPKNNKIKTCQTLLPVEIALILLKLHPIARIPGAGVNDTNTDSEYDLLGLYHPDGPQAGIYTISTDEFRKLIRAYHYSITSKDMLEVINNLKDLAPVKYRCEDPDLIAVNNGIFNYKTKQLIPFDPELVFLSKSEVNYNPNAKNIIIHNDTDNTDWDVESWIKELSDDPEIVNTIWELTSAVIRPNVSWKKAAFLYSEKGNNGKGTLCTLLRNLCGINTCTSIPLNDFSKDFMLEPLINASAIIVDENDVGVYIDKCANLKAVITNDIIQINRKYKMPIAYRFKGFMIQCLNEFPKIKDRSDSFYRRQLFVPFEKCFTGRERSYIKDTYLYDKNVLEYVLYKAVNTNFYTLSEPTACKNILAEYKEFNDPVRRFWEEFSSQFAWDLLPFDFLYDLYKEWFREESPAGTPIGKITFINDLVNIINNDPIWECNDKRAKVRTAKRMDQPEKLILRYSLKNWYNNTYKGNDPNKIAKPELLPAYRGVKRK